MANYACSGKQKTALLAWNYNDILFCLLRKFFLQKFYQICFYFLFLSSTFFLIKDAIKERESKENNSNFVWWIFLQNLGTLQLKQVSFGLLLLLLLSVALEFLGPICEHSRLSVIILRNLKLQLYFLVYFLCQLV